MLLETRGDYEFAEQLVASLKKIGKELEKASVKENTIKVKINDKDSFVVNVVDKEITVGIEAESGYLLQTICVIHPSKEEPSETEVLVYDDECSDYANTTFSIPQPSYKRKEE